jgi:hypothetical protein
MIQMIQQITLQGQIQHNSAGIDTNIHKYNVIS